MNPINIYFAKLSKAQGNKLLIQNSIPIIPFFSKSQEITASHVNCWWELTNTILCNVKNIAFCMYLKLHWFCKSALQKPYLEVHGTDLIFAGEMLYQLWSCICSVKILICQLLWRLQLNNIMQHFLFKGKKVPSTCSHCCVLWSILLTLDLKPYTALQKAYEALLNSWELYR